MLSNGEFETCSLEDEALTELAVVSARFVQDGDNICITNGKANLCLARKLESRRGLTILTNDIAIASEMATQGKRVVLLGGEFDTEEKASFGTLTIENFRNFFVSKVFVEIDGASTDLVFSVNSPTKASFLTEVMAEAKKLIIICPHTRFQSPAFYSMRKLPNYTMVTNSQLEDSYKKRFFEEGIPLFTSVEFGDRSEYKKTADSSDDFMIQAD